VGKFFFWRVWSFESLTPLSNSTSQAARQSRPHDIH
jgi:hypothetical protein